MAQANLKETFSPPHPQPQLLSSGGELRLADWLDVSWFFPAGFKKERTVETPRSYVVLGKSLVYKFYKHSFYRHRAPDSAQDFEVRWLRAIEEVRDNQELCPALYLGMRLLKWADDEPCWLTEIPGNRKAPAQADEAALVMRRIPERALLSTYLKRREEVKPAKISGLAKLLHRFYSHRGREGARLCLEEPDLSLYWPRTSVLEQIVSMMEQYGSFIDPFSTLAFQEAKAFLSSFYREHRALFMERGRQGKVVDSHGSLLCDHICLEPLGDCSRTISVFGRGDAGERFADVLSDIAALTIDMESRGASETARAFEEAFFRLDATLFHPELYRFYRVAAAVKRAAELFYGDDGEYSIEATACLALALRHALGLTKPFLVAIGGPQEECVDNLASSICELSGAVRIEAGSLSGWNMYQGDLDELLFQDLLDQTRKSLLGGSPVVICWPLNREEERLQTALLASQLAVPHILVKCCTHKAPCSALPQGASAGARRLWSRRQAPWPSMPAAFAARQMYLEPIIAQPELALHVVRELAQSVRGPSSRRPLP